MAYQYRGKLTGDQDPWNEASDPYQERVKLPRGVVPTANGRYKARAKHKGKYIYYGTYDTIEAADYWAQILRTRIAAEDPNYLTRKRCGTEAAYRRHLRNGEEACQDCLQAMEEAPKRRAQANPTAAKCGTYNGYQHHLRADQIPCQDCKQARTEYHRNWRAQRAAA